MHTRSGPGWHLLQADYRETCAHVAEQGGADLFAFSPPYCDARTYGANVSWSDADYAALGDAVFAALKPGGHALVNVDAPVREWRKGFGTERGFLDLYGEVLDIGALVSEMIDAAGTGIAPAWAA